MKVAILGTGALGTYYGTRLAREGADVYFLARSNYETICKEGLRLLSNEGDIFLPHPNVYKHPRECGPMDLIIVSWKSFLNHQLEKSLPYLLKEDTLIFTLQNGMGNAESIARFAPQENVCVALCYSTCIPVSPAVVQHVGGNDTRFAPMVNTPGGLAHAQWLADLFARTGIRTTVCEVAEGMLWRKLLLNIPYNGVSVALGGLSSNQLAEVPGAVERMRGVMEEVFHTAELRGFPLPPESIKREMTRIRKMGDFIPSSGQDLLRGRPIEYDSIWEIPLQKALEVGADVPLWRQLCVDIRKRIGRD